MFYTPAGSQHELAPRMDCLFFEFDFVSFSCREQSNSSRGKKDNKLAGDNVGV